MNNRLLEGDVKMSEDRRPRWPFKWRLAGVVAVFAGMHALEAALGKYDHVEYSENRAESVVLRGRALRGATKHLPRGELSLLGLVEMPVAYATAFRRKPKMFGKEQLPQPTQYRLGWPQPLGNLWPFSRIRNLRSLFRELSGR